MQRKIGLYKSTNKVSESGDKDYSEILIFRSAFSVIEGRLC